MKIRILTRVVIAVMVVAAPLTEAVYSHEGEKHDEPPVLNGEGIAGGSALIISKETQFLMGIRTVPARQQTLTNKISAVGRFIPRAEGQADVAPLATGRVIADPDHPIARIADRVVPGSILAVLEQLPADQFALEAAYNVAKGELEQAKQEYTRHQELRKIASLKELQQARARLTVADAEFTRLANEMHLYDVVDKGDRTVHYLYVRAPISGIVTELNLVVGERVDPDRWLFRIISLSPLWVEAAVYETDLPRIEKTQWANLTTNAYPGEQFRGRLIGISGTLDEDSRTAKAIFEVPNLDGRIKVGMFAQVAIDTDEPIEGTTVPMEAILEANGKSLIYVHTQPEEFVAREVTLGQRDGDFIEVKAGVAPGERVVTVGSYQLWSQGLR